MRVCIVRLPPAITLGCPSSRVNPRPARLLRVIPVSPATTPLPKPAERVDEETALPWPSATTRRRCPRAASRGGPRPRSAARWGSISPPAGEALVQELAQGDVHEAGVAGVAQAVGEASFLASTIRCTASGVPNPAPARSKPSRMFSISSTSRPCRGAVSHTSTPR